VLSSLAYQGTALPMDWVETLNAHAVSPDLTLFVGVKPEVAARRRAVRGGPAELFEADAAQRRIAKQYVAAIRRREGRERIVHVDGEQSPEAVTAAALAEIRAVLGRRRR
jgi:dTMP kinase